MKVGSRVVAIENMDGREIKGLTGTIVANYPTTNYDREDPKYLWGVFFDKEFDFGHDLIGHCKQGYGLWVNQNKLKTEYNDEDWL